MAGWQYCANIFYSVLSLTMKKKKKCIGSCSLILTKLCLIYIIQCVVLPFLFTQFVFDSAQKHIYVNDYKTFIDFSSL